MQFVKSVFALASALGMSILFTGCATRDVNKFSPIPEVGDDQLVIHTLPIGAGNCQILQCPSENKLIVFDCGSRGRGDQQWTRDDVDGYVDELADDETEVVITVSHPDIDHYNYIPYVFDQWDVDAIWYGGDLSEYADPFQNWVGDKQSDGANIVSWLGTYVSADAEPDLSCYYEDEDEEWELDSEGYVLMVNAGADSNANSMVVGVDYGAFKTVFTGDMTGETEDAIDNHMQVFDLDNTTFVTGAHHGSTTHGSNAQSWVDELKASAIVFSAGTANSHPWCEAVNRYLPDLEQLDTEVDYACGDDFRDYIWFRTDDAIAVTNDNGVLRVYGSEDGSYVFDVQYTDVEGLLEGKPVSWFKDR